MKRKNAFIFLVILVLVVSGVLFYAFRNKGEEGKEMIISKENTKGYSLDKYEEGFVTYNGIELIHYNTDMDQEWVCTVDEAGAEVYVEGKYIILHNKDNNKVVLVKDGKIVSGVKTDKVLRKASVNENGYMTVLTSDKGYKGQCFVYSDKGKELAEFSFGEKYILGAYLASNNKNLVLNVIDESDSGYKGKILFADIKSGEIKNEIASDEIYSFVKLYEDKVFAESGGNFYCYDKNGKEKWSYAVKSKEILYLGFADKYITMVVKAEESFGANEVLLFNLSGRLKGSYLSESQITAFDSSKGFSAVLQNDKILLINKRGKITSEMEASANINSIKLFKNNDKVLMISEKAVMQKFK